MATPPVIDRPYSGALRLAFSDGFERGSVLQSDGGKWPNGGSGGTPDRPFAQTGTKRSGTYGVQLRCRDLQAGYIWSSHTDHSESPPRQGGPKIGIWKTHFDTPANYNTTGIVMMVSRILIPSSFPNLGSGAMPNNLTVTQIKANIQNPSDPDQHEEANPLMNIVLGRDSSQGDGASDIRIGTHVRPGTGTGRIFAAGNAAKIARDAWVEITQEVYQHKTNGYWRIWLNGLHVVTLSGFDTISRFNGTDGVGTNGYIFYPFNNYSVNSTETSSFSLYGDDTEIWGVWPSGSVTPPPPGTGGSDPGPAPPPGDPSGGGPSGGGSGGAGQGGGGAVGGGSGAGRVFHPAVLEQLEREHSDMIEFIRFDFDDGPIQIAIAAEENLLFDRGGLDAEPTVWHGLGGRIVRGTIQESLDFDAQGMDIQFSCVDPGFEVMGRLLHRSQFAREVEVWWVWYHTLGPEAGKIAAWWLPHRGHIVGRVEIREETADGAVPGQLDVLFRSVSPLALIEIRRGIATNVASHGRWYRTGFLLFTGPDQGFEFVPRIMNRKIYFGGAAPSVNRGGRP